MKTHHKKSLNNNGTPLNEVKLVKRADEDNASFMSNSMQYTPLGDNGLAWWETGSVGIKSAS